MNSVPYLAQDRCGDLALLAPAIAIVVSVLVTTIVIAAVGSSPGDFWSAMFSDPSPRLRVNIINQTAMIYTAAVAAAIGFRMGLFNIGIEGQYLMASFAAASFAGAAYLGGFLNVALSIIIAIAVGAAWAGIAGILRTTRGVSEVISTIMLNAIAVTLVGYLVDRHGVHEGNSVHTKKIAERRHGHGLHAVRAAGRPDLGAVDHRRARRRRLLGPAQQDPLRLRPPRERAVRRRPRCASRRQPQAHDRDLDDAVGRRRRSGLAARAVRRRRLVRHVLPVRSSASPASRSHCWAATGRSACCSARVLFAFLSAQSNTLTFGTDVSPSIVQITQGVAVLAVVVAYEVVRRWRTRLERRVVAGEVAVATEATA